MTIAASTSHLINHGIFNSQVTQESITKQSSVTSISPRGPCIQQVNGLDFQPNAAPAAMWCQVVTQGAESRT